MDQANLYGKGVFSTLRITDSAPFLWEKHWCRLEHDAAAIKLDLFAHTEESTKAALMAAISDLSLDSGRARITFSDRSPSDLWQAATEGGTTLSIATGPLRPISRPFKLTVSPYAVNSGSPLAGVKSCNYLEQILSLDEAKHRGFHEAIRLNERGLVTGGCMANVFWLQDGQLFTPSLSTGCLPGTTREFVLEHVDCEEVEADIEQAQSADGIFLTSAGLGIVAAGELESRQFDVIEHPLTDLLSATR